jgi:hypothetical protein
MLVKPVFENVVPSIHSNCDLRSNVNDVSDLHSEKQDGPRISTEAGRETAVNPALEIAA